MMEPAKEPVQTFLQLPPSAPRSLHILILLCDTPNPAVSAAHGTYGTIFTTLFRNSILFAEQEQEQGQGQQKGGHDIPPPHASRNELTLVSYDVVRDSYPTKEKVQQADAVLITGSAANAYDPLPWITRLKEFVADLPNINPSAKLFGICFGHQIIARAFGGDCVPNGTWEIGVRNIELTETGKKVFGGSSAVTIHQMHRDHVPTVPAGFELLGSTSVAPVQGMVRYSQPPPSDTDFSLPCIGIITFQGHPEFSPDIVNKIIDMREAGKVISHELAEESRAYAKEHDEGVRIGRILLGILGV